MPKRPWAKISQIRTLPVARISAKLGVGGAALDELDQSIEGLNEIIGD